MDNIEEVRKNISICKAYMNLYNLRKIKVDEEIEKIIYHMGIEIRGGYGEKYNQYYRGVTIYNNLTKMVHNEELTREKYDMYYMSFTDYMFKYGTKYL